ncbi:MAG: hypothetical protein H6815_14100 [Phycisphaeraceae bacterium]|nr:hypothetical protein [Phycisphaerales bacterium]MCB9861572.1 hypothetical protein [Phycisphaeraceae bacterium]
MDEQTRPDAWSRLYQTMQNARANPTSAHAAIHYVLSLVGLGLRTLASLECKRLISSGLSKADSDSIQREIEQLQCDVISADERLQCIKQNLAAARTDLDVSESDIESWLEGMSDIVWYRTVDGNIVRRNTTKHRLAHFQDLQTVCRSNVSELRRSIEKNAFGPVIMHGIDPPWGFAALLESESPPDVPGFVQRIIVVQQNKHELISGLACGDLSEKLKSKSVLWYVGEHAQDELLSHIRARRDYAFPQAVVVSPVLQDKAIDFVSLLREAERDARAYKEDVIVSFSQPASKMISEDVGNRFRILLPTSRFTTYVQHAVTDLASELELCGCECKVCIEEDTSSVFHDFAYTNACADFQPDAVIAVNYTRSFLGRHFPQHLPYICWVQDSMDHLHDPDSARALSSNDCLVGMVDKSYADRYGYDPGQLQYHPMVSSNRKFFRSVSQSERVCDVAWVTNHSETVECMRTRLLGAIGSIPSTSLTQIGEVLDSIERGLCAAPSKSVYAAVNEAARTLTSVPDDIKHRLNASIFMPFAERVFRHQVVEWLADICDRRNWSLGLFGNGWEDHPQFAKYARGAVLHGEQLRLAYQQAGVHIHASLFETVHQRVMECILSGGLPLCRVARDAFGLLGNRVAAQAFEQGLCHQKSTFSATNIEYTLHIEHMPEAQKFVSKLMDLELCDASEFRDGVLTWTQKQLDNGIYSEHDEIESQRTDYLEHLSDLCFATPQRLEQLLELYLSDETARDERTYAAEAAMPECFTTTGLAKWIIAKIHQMIQARKIASRSALLRAS